MELKITNRNGNDDEGNVLRITTQEECEQGANPLIEEYMNLYLVWQIFPTIKAHEVAVSTIMLVEQEDNFWTLQIRSPLVAFEKEIHSHFAAFSYATVEKFKEQVIEHLSNTLQISANNKFYLVLENGTVKLGHESAVFFEQIILSKNIISIKVTNYAFNDIYGSKTVLFIVKKDFYKTPLILNVSNEHTVELAVKDNSLITDKKDSKEETTFSYSILFSIFMILVISIIISIIFWINRKRKINRNT